MEKIIGTNGIIKEITISDPQEPIGGMRVVRSLSLLEKSIIIGELPFKDNNWIQKFKVTGACDCNPGDEVFMMIGESGEGLSLKINGNNYPIIESDIVEFEETTN